MSVWHIYLRVYYKTVSLYGERNQKYWKTNKKINEIENDAWFVRDLEFVVKKNVRVLYKND